MTIAEFLDALNNIGNFSAGAYTASGNQGFHEIHTMVNKIIDVIRVPIELAKEQRLDSDISELDFTCRTFNALKEEGIESIRDLIEKTEDYLRKITNLGKKSLVEIKEVLESEGLALKQ